MRGEVFSSRRVVCGLVFAVFCMARAESALLFSPDGWIEFEPKMADGAVAADVRFGGTDVVHIDDIVKGAGVVAAVSNGCSSSVWRNDFGERKLVKDEYNLAIWDFKPNGDGGIRRLEVRMYDAGVAWRVGYEAQGGLAIESEPTEYVFGGDWRCWPVTHSQGKYEPFKLSDFDKARAKPDFAPVAAGIGEMHNYELDFPGTMEAPFVVEGDGFVAALGDAAVTNWAKLRYGKGERPNTVKSVLEGAVAVPSVSAQECVFSAWRYVRVAKDACKLYEGNDLLLNLNEPAKIDDVAWIHPGKVLRVARLDTATAKAAVDFAKANNMQFIELDCGWYGQEHTGDPANPGLAPERVAKGAKFDLFEILAYAKEHAVPVILYVNREPLKKNIDGILPLLKSWGVAGIKYGFVNVGAQRWYKWMTDAIEKGAENRLMLDAHDEYRLTGNQRTWPNILTVEGIHGNEEMPDSAHNAALIFTRYLAGPGDYTPCWNVPRVKNTLAHQLALAGATFSPWQFLFWYQRPDQIDAANPALDYWREIPTVWDETKALQGEIGKYAVIARRSGVKWFVSGLNGLEKRKFEISLDFLGDGEYDVRIFADADADMESGLGEVAITRKTATKCDMLEIAAAARGGFGMILEPAAETKEQILKARMPQIFKRAAAQFEILDAAVKDDTQFPRSWTKGVLKTEPAIGWTTGFFPGSLWYVYNYTKDPKFRTLAEKWTERLDSARHFTKNHDMGFMFYCSYGNGIRYGGHGDDYKSAILDASAALATRWDEKMSLIRSWDEPVFMQFPVIIDSMMNLEMLEYAAKTTGDANYDRIARLHANKLDKTHFRADESAYHVTDWNPKIGKIWARYAWQGADVEGAWARGQGWSIYGYTMMFRETGDTNYLARAVKSAEWIVHAPNLPADKIPYWDYHASDIPDAPRDASAAAVMACGFLELARYVDEAKSREYRNFALDMLLALSSDEYLCEVGECGGFLLKHSTGHLPENTEIDASINYADYYFLEALTRIQEYSEK